jgi:hypothetical protein
MVRGYLTSRETNDMENIRSRSVEMRTQRRRFDSIF